MLKERLIVGMGVLAWCAAFLTGIALVASVVSMFLGAGDQMSVVGACVIFVPSILAASAIEWVARTTSTQDEAENQSAVSQDLQGTSRDEGPVEESHKPSTFRVFVDVILVLIFGGGAINGLYLAATNPLDRTPGQIYGVIILACLCYWSVRDLLEQRKRRASNPLSDESSGLARSSE